MPDEPHVERIVSKTGGDLQAIVERAATDPDFVKQLAADPLAAAHEAGVRITPNDLKMVLGMPEASDQELVEALQSRISAAKAGVSSFATQTDIVTWGTGGGFAWTSW